MKLKNIKNSPENTALLIIPRLGFPLVECAHGNPCPGGNGNTCGPAPARQNEAISSNFRSKE